jgi:hypothetical protein
MSPVRWLGLVCLDGRDEEGGLSAVNEPVAVVGDDEECLLAKLIGRQVLGLAYVPATDAAMLQFDAETCCYFRIVDNRLQIEIEAPPIQ